VDVYDGMLHGAAIKGDVTMCDWVISIVNDIADDTWRLTLLYAYKYKRHDIVNWYYMRRGAVEIGDAMAGCAEGGHLDMLRIYLLQHTINPSQPLDMEDILVSAFHGGSIECVEFLLALGIRGKVSVRKKHLHLFEYLEMRYPEVIEQNLQGMMGRACAEACFPIMKKLIHKVNLEDDTYLIAAINIGGLKVVKFLLDHGVVPSKHALENAFGLGEEVFEVIHTRLGRPVRFIDICAHQPYTTSLNAKPEFECERCGKPLIGHGLN
jgi:hypothetical protein